MGCCTPTNKNMIDFRFEKVDEFNKLKSEIDEIISDPGHKDRKNVNKLFELFNKTASKINEYEREVKKLKNKKATNKKVDDNMMQGLINDIRQLREYNHTLNDLIKKSDENDVIYTETKPLNINENQIKTESEYNNIDNEIEIINKQKPNTTRGMINNNEMRGLNINNKKFNLKKFIENDIRKGNKGKYQSESENDFIINDGEKTPKEKEIIGDLKNSKIHSISSSIENNSERDDSIYYKKSIRRNKRSEVLNRKSYPNDQENDNIINLILALENGQNVGVQAEKTQKFLVILEKLGENEEDYTDIENLELYDENGEITEKVLNGDIISSFGFTDNQIIQIKLKN